MTRNNFLVMYINKSKKATKLKMMAFCLLYCVVEIYIKLYSNLCNLGSIFVPLFVICTSLEDSSSLFCHFHFPRHFFQCANVINVTIFPFSLKFFLFLCHLHFPRSFFNVSFLFCHGFTLLNLAQLGFGDFPKSMHLSLLRICLRVP